MSKIRIKPIDLYHPTLQDYRFLKKQSELIKSLKKQVRLTTGEIQALMLFYNMVTRQYGPMNDTQFGEILHCTLDMSDQFMVDCIMKMLLKGAEHKSFLTMDIWIKVMGIFLKGSLDEKMEFCFKVYDIADKGYLGRVDIMRFVKSFVINARGEPDEDAIVDLVDMLMKKLDLDRDGKILFSDYRRVVKARPEMMEFLGNCLPNDLVASKFLTTFSKDVTTKK